jgi:protein MPE1
MASYVYFKFKSQKEPQRVTIDGPHTDVWNLKREIISISRLGDGTDFDLKIYKENSNEGKLAPTSLTIQSLIAITEYTDDTEIIPKDSTVLARRLPASAPGKGRAARYVSGKPPVSARPASSSAVSKPIKPVEMDKTMTEKERLQAMLNFTDAQWQQKQEEMSHETRVPLQGKPFNKKASVPEGEPPQGYVCYRCLKKGKLKRAHVFW